MALRPSNLTRRTAPCNPRSGSSGVGCGTPTVSVTVSLKGGPADGLEQVTNGKQTNATRQRNCHVRRSVWRPAKRFIASSHAEPLKGGGGWCIYRRLRTKSRQSKSFSARKRQIFSLLLFLRRRVTRVDDPRAIVNRLRALLTGLDDLDLRHDYSLLRRAGRFMRQRNQCRFKSGLVTCRHVHVAKLSV